jgi:hypothetical protein
MKKTRLPPRQIPETGPGHTLNVVLRCSVSDRAGPEFVCYSKARRTSQQSDHTRQDDRDERRFGEKANPLPLDHRFTVGIHFWKG